VWGDGKATRDFLYADDVADGILLAAEKLEAPNYYVNLASENEISIGDLVRMIARLCDFKHDIVFDESKGGGDPRRSASGKKAQELLGFVPKVELEEGLCHTIEWYEMMQKGQK
jgi:GDP-L-fucose synthase